MYYMEEDVLGLIELQVVFDSLLLVGCVYWEYIELWYILCWNRIWSLLFIYIIVSKHCNQIIRIGLDDVVDYYVYYIIGLK